MKPKAGKTAANGFTINYGNQLQLAKNDSRSKWTIAEVLHRSGKTFSPETVKGKPKKPFQPKVKYLCWLAVSSKDDPLQRTFTYAVELKSGAFKPTTLNQEKRIARDMSYRNGVSIVNDKNVLETKRLAAYGNRLPRVGVMAKGPSKLHEVGFISDRFAITQLGFESYDDFKASTSFKFGEKKPYIPKPLAGMLQDIEEENDELSVEEEEDDDDEEESDEGDPYGDDEDDGTGDDDDDDEVSNAPESDSVEEAGERRFPATEALQDSRSLMSVKATDMADVISRTDMLRRIEEIDAGESGMTLKRGSKRKPEIPALKEAKKQKSKPVEQPVVVAAAATSAAPPKPTAVTPPKKASTASPAVAEQNAFAPTYVSAEEIEEIHNGRGSLYLQDYTTADFMAENYPKICANAEALDYYTQPDKVTLLDKTTNMHSLVHFMSTEHPDVISIFVPFLYELFCKHYGKPVPNPTRLTAPPPDVDEMLAKLPECNSWEEQMTVVEGVFKFMETENSRSRQPGTVFEVIDRTVQAAWGHSHHDLLGLVFDNQVKVHVGIRAHGDEAERKYIAAVKKDEDLNITLFNLYKEFLQRTAVADYDKPEIKEKDGRRNFFD